MLRDAVMTPRLLPLLLLLAAMASVAPAADELLTGDRLVLSKHRLGVISRDGAITLGRGKDSPDDPVMHGGALRVLSIEGDVFDQTYSLPAERWRYVRQKRAVVGYAFRGPAPIGTLLLKAGKLVRITGGGARLGHTLGRNPAPVRVILTLGQQQYCMSFGGTTTFKTGMKYLAANAPAPDVCPLPYGNDTSWLCRPGMASKQCCLNGLDATVVPPDLSTTVESEMGSVDHPDDCFYVYPTVDLSGTPGNHADVTDPGYVGLTLDPLLSQAARFNALCRVFAPHYRQVTFGTFTSTKAAQYLDLAYRDVLDAWRLYLKNDNGGRNVVIMGHSQGTFMTTRLIQEEVDPSAELRGRLIVALLIGGSVTVPQGGVVGGSFQNVPLCDTVAQTGCVIAYRSYAEGFAPANGSNAIAGSGMDTACTNPAALGGAGVFSRTYFPTHTNQPAFQIASNPGIPTAFVEFPQFYSGACVKDDTGHSYLQVSVSPRPGDQRANPIPFNNLVLAPSILGTHILDYNWTMGDLLALVAAKEAALR